MTEIAYKPTIGTLCYIKDERGRILLQLKAKGKFGELRWNAPGGKLLPEEDLEIAAKREVREETGLEVNNIEKNALLNFYISGYPGKLAWQVYVFRALDWKGKLRTSTEGKLEWFSTDSIPYNQMWEDDKHWLPLLLKDKKFTGHFWFEGEFEHLVRYKIEETI